MKKYLIIIFIFFYYNSASGIALFDTEFYEIKFISDNVEDTKIKKINEIKFKSINNIFNKILEKNDFNSLKREINEDLINTAWPQVDTKNLIDPTYELVVQINGKKRYTRQTDIGLEQSEVEKICKVEFNMNLSDYKKIIYIPDKIINFVG